MNVCYKYVFEAINCCIYLSESPKGKAKYKQDIQKFNLSTTYLYGFSDSQYLSKTTA